MFAFLILFAVAFFLTTYSIPRSIRKLREKEIFAIDRYKLTKPKIPTNAGIIITFTSFISISILPFLSRSINQLNLVDLSTGDLSNNNLAFLLVISIYAMYGLIDDLLDLGHRIKLILPIAFGYPLISVLNPSVLTIPFFGDYDLDQTMYSSITFGDIFRITVIPIYIMVVANLFNMHSGYNGLQSGLSIIVLSTLVIKSWLDGVLNVILPTGAFLGSMFVLWWYNKFPARIFEGNVGSLLFGSIIGSVIVIQQYWWFGFFILIPHTFNFALWLIWIRMMKTNPDEYLDSNGKHRKFGYLRDDNTISVPNRLTLKWIPNYYWRLTEQQSTRISYLITGVFCFLGIIIFI